MRRSLTTLLTLFLVLTLGGCASRWVVDSDVTSFSRIGSVPPGATYRYERLPSQQGDESGQARLEAMADAALAGVGLRRDDAAARYSVQIGARVRTELSPWADPWFHRPWGPRYGYPGWYGPWGYGYGPMFPPPSQTWYAREVSIVMRELPAGTVVYETRARSDGPYAGSADVLPVMFRAALQGFPNPPPGPRRVDIEIPPAQPATAPAPAR